MSEMIARRSLAVAVLILAAPAWGHDSWVVAEKNVTGACGSVRVAFVTSENFPKSEHATKPERVAEWVAVGAGMRQRISKYAIQGEELVANPQIEPIGLFTIGAALKPHPIEMSYEKFETYLADERAESALGKLRRGDATKRGPQRELYTKFGKTFVEVLPESGERAALPPLLGHKLEIQPTSDPCLWSAGCETEVQVLFDGRPTPYLRVSSGREGMTGHSYVQSVTTDANGMARLDFKQPGLWFVRTHLIRPAEGEAAKSADWESWWASITFRVSGEPPVAVMLDEVSAIHGAAGPWAVAGYRMGLRALKELGLKRGSFDLEVIHETPMQVQYSCMADGIQAATGASAGKLNLKLKEVAPEGLRTVFRKKSTGETCVMELKPSLKARILYMPYEAFEQESRVLVRLPDEEVMTVHRAEEKCHATTQAGGK